MDGASEDVVCSGTELDILWHRGLRANYAFKPIAGQSLRPNQTIVPQRLNAALGVMGGQSLSRFTLKISIIILVGYSPAALGADLCLLGLGPNWEDINADASEPVAEVAEQLERRGELRPEETERWFRDKAGRVIYCRHTFDVWNSFLFELTEGQWKQVNSVRKVL